MRTIIDKTELAMFFRDELLPYYEKHYREDLTCDDAWVLHFGRGMCLCAKKVFKVDVYIIMMAINSNYRFLFVEIMGDGYSAKESLLPRIEWMKNFIKDNL